MFLGITVAVITRATVAVVIAEATISNACKRAVEITRRVRKGCESLALGFGSKM